MNYYEILGVDKDFTPEELKKAYRKLCKEHHPDQDGEREMFESIKKAYDTLKDPEKKQRYDEFGCDDDLMRTLITCAISIFKKALSLDNGNIETDIKSVYEEMILMARNNIETCEKDISKNKSILKKIVHAPKNDFIGNLLNSEIKENERAIITFNKAIEDLHTVHKMLKAYMFDNSVVETDEQKRFKELMNNMNHSNFRGSFY